MPKQNKGTVETADVQATPAGTAIAGSNGKFSKDQVLASATFANRRDLLAVLLDSGKQYTVAEVERVMDGWLNKGVE